MGRGESFVRGADAPLRHHTWFTQIRGREMRWIIKKTGYN